MSEKKKFTGKEFYGKENPIRQAFKPILPFVVPHMVFPMENFAERVEELQRRRERTGGENGQTREEEDGVFSRNARVAEEERRRRRWEEEARERGEIEGD